MFVSQLQVAQAIAGGAELEVAGTSFHFCLLSSCHPP